MSTSLPVLHRAAPDFKHQVDRLGLEFPVYASMALALLALKRNFSTYGASFDAWVNHKYRVVMLLSPKA